MLIEGAPALPWRWPCIVVIKSKDKQRVKLQQSHTLKGVQFVNF